jgi:hypothetical protein
LTSFTSSSLYFFSALSANSYLNAVVDNNLGANALIAVLAIELNLGCVDSALGLKDLRCLALTASLGVLGNDVSTLNDYLALFGRGSENGTANTLRVTGDNNDFVVFFNMKLIHFNYLLQIKALRERGT